jgi:hypothetical protein
MGIVTCMLSYGLLLFVVLAALYFSPGPDPRDMNPMPAMRMTHPNGLQICYDGSHTWDRCENFQLKDFRTRVHQIYERPLRQH